MPGGPARGSKSALIRAALEDFTISADKVQPHSCLDLTRALLGKADGPAFECIGLHASASGNRFEALEPIRQGVRQHFGGYEYQVAAGLAVRHDHGSAYLADGFQRELRFLGIQSSPSFVREPQGNDGAERFIHLLTENLPWVRTFDTIEELRQALLVFKEPYNAQWVLQRHGYRTPNQVRQQWQETRRAEAAG